MATATESETDVGISSDDIDKPFICKPCGEDGEQLKAVGFCVNCSEYLCRKCYDVHLIPSITRKHVLKWLEKAEETDATHESKYLCQQHGDENIKYHCPTHSFFGCHVCFYRHQKSCKDVIYIPDVAMTTPASGECGQFYQKLTNIRSNCMRLVSEVKSNLQTITSKHSEAITAISDFKKELIDIIDKLEKEMIEKIDKHQIDETQKMEELSINCEKILEHAQKMSASMEMLQNKDRNCDLYIEIVQSKDAILNFEDQLKLIEKNKLVNMPVFQPNKYLTDILMSPWSLGSLSLKSLHIEKLDFLQDITCKSRNDTQYCNITESVLLPGQKLIVTDCQYEHTIKLIDLQQNKIQSDLKLSPSWGICKITDTSVAVTLPDDKEIAFLRTNPTLAVEREIKLNEKPRGIDHLDSKLVVSYNDPCKIEMMDMEGRLIRTISTNDNGHSLVIRPPHIAIHPINKHIYVSNGSSNTVVCMTMDGTVVATYKDKELSLPRQVTFDNSGMVYVCGERSHNVHQITTICQKVKVILTSSDGLNNPCSISYEENEGLFYIGEWPFYIGERPDSTIKVYKVANSAI